MIQIHLLIYQLIYIPSGLESMELVHIDSSDESLAPVVSLPVVVALSRSNSVNAGDDEDKTFIPDGFSFAPIRVSLPAPALIG